MVAQGARRNRNAQGGGNRQNQGQGPGFGEMAGSMMARPQELVSDYPVSSVLLVFGVGLGVGFVLASAICESSMWQPQETTTQRWGRQLHDTFSHMVPESVSRRFS
jgi:hypothetical protein